VVIYKPELTETYALNKLWYCV